MMVLFLLVLMIMRLHNLKKICNEIFGEDNFIETCLLGDLRLEYLANMNICFIRKILQHSIKRDND
jgi:hypothetical protein